MNSYVKLWLDHPVTKKYRELLKEHRESHIYRILHMNVLSEENLGELAQIKGQVNALDLMLNLDDLENLFDGEINEEGIQAN